MANYTAADIKALREQTGAGMLDVKKARRGRRRPRQGHRDPARQGPEGRHQGEGRTTSNGLVTARAGNGEGTRRGPLRDRLRRQGREVRRPGPAGPRPGRLSGAADADSLLKSTLADGKTVQELLDEANATIGEKIEVKRVARLEGGTVVSYLHKTSPDLPAQIGVLLGAEGGDEQVARDVAMHIAAFSPTVLTRDEVDAETVENERRVAEATAKEEGSLRLPCRRSRVASTATSRRTSCSLQPFAKDAKKTVGKVLEEAGATAQSFARFRVGG